MQQYQKQKGYTMVLFIAFIIAVLLAGFSLYDNGTVASERIRMQNTADATAYSTMNVLSRDMNFIAYTNRAMVANQVAMAQMVGLSSWIHMLDRMIQNIDDVATWAQLFPPVGVPLKRVTKIIATITDKGKRAFDKFAGFTIKALDAYGLVISKSQHGFQIITVDMAVATYNEVSKANDADIKQGFVTGTYAAMTLAKTWKKELDRNKYASTRRGRDQKRWLARYREFAGVVRDSRDPFSSKRSRPWMNWIGAGLAGFSLKASIQKIGGTDFREVKQGRGRNLQWEWTAMDTVSFWLRVKTWWSTKTFEAIPMGGGAAHALNGGRRGNKDNFAYRSQSRNQATFFNQGSRLDEKKKWRRWGNGAWQNGMTASQAAYVDRGNNLERTKGLRAFWDLKKNEKKDTGPQMISMLTKDTDKVRLQQTLDEESTDYNRSATFNIEQQGSIANETLYGLSKAETYFSRPKDLWPRPDGYREYGNLYNPFWQTRLIDTNIKERLAAIAAAHLM